MPAWFQWAHEERGDNAHFDERTRSALFNENMGGSKYPRKAIVKRAQAAEDKAKLRRTAKKEAAKKAAADAAKKKGAGKPWWLR